MPRLNLICLLPGVGVVVVVVVVVVVSTGTIGGATGGIGFPNSYVKKTMSVQLLKL